MLPKFHLFCSKQNNNDADTAKIKAIKITAIDKLKNEPYQFDILYKDGTTSTGHTASAKTLHDNYDHFLPVKLVRELHNQLRDREIKANMPMTYADYMMKGGCEKTFNYDEWYYRNNGSYPDTYERNCCR